MAIFKVNNPNGIGEKITDVSLYMLVDMNHGEGGYEVWDVSIQNNAAQFSPYRIKMIVDDCVVISYEMINAG
jgi:hypothetical protein